MSSLLDFLKENIKRSHWLVSWLWQTCRYAVLPQFDRMINGFADLLYFETIIVGLLEIWGLMHEG